jgi:hypothetical protein
MFCILTQLLLSHPRISGGARRAAPQKIRGAALRAPPLIPKHKMA